MERAKTCGCPRHKQVQKELEADTKASGWMKGLLLGVLEQARSTCGTGTVGNGSALPLAFKMGGRRGR